MFCFVRYAVYPGRPMGKLTRPIGIDMRTGRIVAYSAIKSKYGNRKVEVDGRKYDSQREADRAQELIMMEKTGAIRDLQFQVPFPIVIGEVKICKYIADFTYQFQGKLWIEDCKAPFLRKNPVYRLKKKMVKAVTGIDIFES